MAMEVFRVKTHESPRAWTRRTHEVELELARIWGDVLGIPAWEIDLDANFISLGGDSVLIARVAEEVAARFFADRAEEAPGIADYFSHGTLRAFAERLGPSLANAAAWNGDSVALNETGVAIIGMACRFPGATDVQTFWRNLRDGVESIRTFSDDELLAAGVSSATLKHTSYVKARAVLDGWRLFDAGYFKMTPREAALTSPEQRLLLECSEEALQDAGYGNCGEARPVGVFVGTGVSSYFLQLLGGEPGNLESPHGMGLFAANTCAASRVSYLLNLVGPSLTIDTACSSSLVAVHAACRSLIHGECTMALAGGATVRCADRGYVAEPGGIFSPDGHCRPFDRQAQGTVSSSGAGMVLLKRLPDALADGDFIYAVIRGTAINNDGGEKAGYTAPSASGQAGVIRAALAAAHVDPGTIRYIETHGTGTSLGDAVEMSALRQVFAGSDSGETRVALGALKANLGHMEAAAGIGALIKTALVLQHRQIPPAIHFQDWAAALREPPFEFSPYSRDFAASDVPLRAGVSAFGIGGTNAHAVLQEAPPAVRDSATRSVHLLTLSAHSDTALRESSRRLAARLRTSPPGLLADVAYSLQVGRKQLGHRMHLVVCNMADAAHALEAACATLTCQGHREPRPPVVLMFPDVGAQFAGMFLQLYDSEPQLRPHLDECGRILQRLLGRNATEVLRTVADDPADGQWCQPALFAVEYSLARLWLSWGVVPSMMVGCGVGECVAACLAGLFGLEDAFRITIARGRLAHSSPADETADLVAFAKVLRSVQWGELRIPYVSMLTGQPAQPQHVAGTEYWMSQLRASAPFAVGVRHLLGHEQGVFLEVGPGSRLCELLRAELRSQSCTVVASAASDGPEWNVHVALLRALGQVWEGGVEIDWQAFNAGFALRRVPLPTYPFERSEHWMHSEPFTPPTTLPAGGTPLELSEWFHLAMWEQTPSLPLGVPLPAAADADRGEECWLIFGAWGELESAVRQRSAGKGIRLARVSLAEAYSRHASVFTVDRRNPASIALLFDALERDGHPVAAVIHCAEAGGGADVDEPPDDANLAGLYGLSYLCAGLASLRRRPARLTVVTRGACAIGDESVASPRRAMLAAATEVVAKELPDVRCRMIDIAPAEAKTVQAGQVALDMLMAEMTATSAEPVIAIRGARRWRRTYRRTPLRAQDPARSLLRRNGVYLVTGGMGGIGWTLARFLARELRARLLLVGRSRFPERSEWLSLADDAPAAHRIREIHSLEAAGARLLVESANVTSLEDMNRVVRLAISEFGGLNGVIHAAGVPRTTAARLRTHESFAAVLGPKVLGTWATYEACKSQALDFFVCCSSIASVLTPAGWYEYCAANAFQDAFCEAHDLSGGTRFISIAWDRWSEVGMAAANGPAAASHTGERSEESAYAIAPAQGVEIFRRALANPASRWIISTRGLDQHLRDRPPTAEPQGDWQKVRAATPSGTREGRSLAAIQSELTHIWRELLGVEAVRESDDFFSLGGDSLLALDLHTQLEARFERAPSLRELLVSTTLGEMAQLLQATS
jgi:phthiocerol/phenolphthiocerol synthesis type-I polyketide synthase E